MIGHLPEKISITLGQLLTLLFDDRLIIVMADDTRKLLWCDYRSKLEYQEDILGCIVGQFWIDEDALSITIMR